MKTLFIVSNGIGKPTDEVIRKLETEDKAPRYSLMEKELNTLLLDERYLETIPDSRKAVYKWLPIDLVFLLEAWLIHNEFDVVLSYYERVGLPFAMLQKILGSTVPHVLMTTWFSSPIKAWFLQQVHDNLAKIITWSSNQYNFAIEELGIPEEQIKLVNRGTDQAFWRPIEAKTDKICAVGMEQRDYTTFVKAMEELDIPCHIATGVQRGQLFNTVKKLYEIDELPDNITVGRREYANLRSLYAQCRFVVVPLLPTDTDNGLTTILEAMAMGKPVICSRTKGQIDVIEDNKTGLFVPQGDPVALREAIRELWDNPDKAEKMGRAARKYIEQNHRLEQFVEAVKKESESVVSESVLIN